MIGDFEVIIMNDFRTGLVGAYLHDLALDASASACYRGRTILVTGGAGAIGSNLTIALSMLVGESGKVIVLDNLSASKLSDPWNLMPLPNLLFVRGDVRDDRDLKRVFGESPTMVFHLAAFFANQNSLDYQEESADVDVMGLIKLLTYSRLAGVEKFVYASSGCAIYGSYPEMPLKEDFISMHLTTPYQINKMTGEMYCNLYNYMYDLKTVNCRFFNSYGPGEAPGQYRNVIPNFLYWAMKGLPLPITGTGEETRDFTYVMDLVQGLLQAGVSESAVGQNFNLAAGKEIRIIDLAEMVNRVTENTAGVVFKKRRKWDTKPRLLASIEKAQELIGYTPLVDFETGLLKNAEWFHQHWDLIQSAADFPPGVSSAVRDAEEICSDRASPSLSGVAG